MQIPLRRLYCATLSLCGFHYTNFIMRIPSCAFHRKRSIARIPLCKLHRAIGRIPSCGFHCADSILCIPLYGFQWCKFHHRVFHCTGSMVRITLCGFYRTDFILCIPSYIVQIPLCGFLRANFIVQIPSCVSHCVHSIICTPLCNRRRKEEVKKDGKVGTLAHRFHICICVAVDINGDASTDNVLGESPSTESASTTLYRSHCMCGIDY